MTILVGLLVACGATDTSAEPEAAAPPVIEAQVTVVAPAASPTPEAPADPAEALKAALETKDYATIQALMAPNFGFGLIASEGTTYTPESFVNQLQTSYLEPGSVQVNLTRDVSAEISPDYKALVDSYAGALYSSGWGESQADTALLFLNEQGQWSGMLYVFEGLEDELGLFDGGGAAPVESPGESESAEEPPPGLEGVDNTALGPVQNALLDSITEKRDYARLQALMGEPFVIGYWRSEGVSLDPAAAAAELENNLLPPEAFVNYTLTGDLSSMLDGQNPLDMWGPDVNAVRAIHSTGWGQDGNDEAIIVLAQRDNGTYYWHSLLYAAGGF